MSTDVGMGRWVANTRAEWGKAWSVRVPGLWLLTSVLVCLVTATTLANDFVHAIAVGEVAVGSLMPVVDSFGPAVSFAQVTVAAFAIHLVTPEYSSGSIGPTFVAEPRRWVVLGAKTSVAVVSAALVGAVFGPLTGMAVDWTLGPARGEPLPWTAAALGAALTFASAAAIGIALAFLVRSAVGALSTAFLLLVVTLTAPTSVGRYLPGPGGAALVEDLGAGRVPWEGLGVLGGWATVLSLLAASLVGRRDA